MLSWYRHYESINHLCHFGNGICTTQTCTLGVLNNTDVDDLVDRMMRLMITLWQPSTTTKDLVFRLVNFGIVIS